MSSFCPKCGNSFPVAPGTTVSCPHPGLDADYQASVEVTVAQRPTWMPAAPWEPNTILDRPGH